MFFGVFMECINSVDANTESPFQAKNITQSFIIYIFHLSALETANKLLY